MGVAVLDNPIWGSLHEGHGGLADLAWLDGARAGRYQPDVAPFGAVEDPGNPACWEALASILDGHPACLIIDPADVPGGWEIVTAIPGVQMEGAKVAVAHDPEAVTLGLADVPEMLALVERTRPGPYRPRTVEMGCYLGLRDQTGSMIAMAGERLHPDGWTELSAVCTDPAQRGQGLGTRLVLAVAAGIRDRGELPFLHAAADNLNAIRLYEALGFTVRRECSFTILRPKI